MCVRLNTDILYEKALLMYGRIFAEWIITTGLTYAENVYENTDYAEDLDELYIIVVHEVNENHYW